MGPHEQGCVSFAVLVSSFQYVSASKWVVVTTCVDGWMDGSSSTLDAVARGELQLGGMDPRIQRLVVESGWRRCPWSSLFAIGDVCGKAGEWSRGEEGRRCLRRLSDSRIEWRFVRLFVGPSMSVGEGIKSYHERHDEELTS